MTRLTYGAALLALGALLPPFASGQETKETEGGWIALFDGKSLDGWEVNDTSNGKGTKWEVQDGALCGSGPASMLAYVKQPYKNFRFRAEIKINDKGNSGMYFRCKSKKPGFVDGYEAQINATHTDPIKSGSLYKIANVMKANHQPDEYFTQEVECRDVVRGGKVVTAVKVTVNGAVQVDTVDEKHQFAEGYFAFQQHDPGSKVSIRKVEVMPLPDVVE